MMVMGQTQDLDMDLDKDRISNIFSNNGFA